MSIDLSWQDMQEFIRKGNKEEFILKAIDEHKRSEEFTSSARTWKYYRRENVAINERMSFLDRKGIRLPVRFNKLASGFLQKFILQWVYYSLGNGLTLDKEKKSKLGRGFGISLLLDGVVPAALDGVCYGFWNNDEVRFLKIYENNGYNGFFPVLDERTSNIKAGIKFRQANAKKPMFVELFEINGITEYQTDKDKNKLTAIDQRPRPYKTHVFKSPSSEYVVGEENYSELPIYPLHVNELKVSEFNDGFRSYIDAFDFVSSDQVDQITMSEGIHWIVKNLGGEDFRSAFEMLQAKIYSVDTDAQTEVASHVVEAPFQSKQATLEFLERRMYADFLIPPAQNLGQVVTATEIKYANQELDNKADILEWRVCDFVEKLLKLIGVPFEQDEVKFKRRSVINDSEIIDNISTMLTDQYVDAKWAVENNPLITDADQEALLARLAIAETEKANNDFPMTDDDPEDLTDGQSGA